MRRRTTTAVAIVAALAIFASQSDHLLAQHHGGPVRGPVFIGGYFYDPFFGPYPWWGPGMYGYPYFPIYDDRAQVKLLVTPKEAAVYVDGYYAGVVDDFDGFGQSLPLSPGGHEIAVYLEGYRTVEQKLFLTHGKSYKVRYAMVALAAGGQSAAPPVAPPVPPPPPGSAVLPRGGQPGAPSAGASAPSPAAASGFGALAVRVQPADADVLIDGEKWTASQSGDPLNVQITAGVHHIVIQKPGYRTYTNDITVQPGAATPLNVSLSTQ